LWFCSMKDLVVIEGAKELMHKAADALNSINFGPRSYNDGLYALISHQPMTMILILKMKTP
jgi:hypothetical protein